MDAEPVALCHLSHDSRHAAPLELLDGRVEVRVQKPMWSKRKASVPHTPPEISCINSMYGGPSVA